MGSPEPLRLTVIARVHDEDSDLLAAGELDLATAPSLEATLGDLVATTNGDVRVDCGELTFVDSSGVSVLVAVAQRLARDGRKLVLRDASEQFRQVLAVTALDEVFVIE